MTDDIARRICDVCQAGDLENDYGDVDHKVLPPRIYAWGIDTKKSDEQDALDGDGDEEVQCHNHRDQGGRQGVDEGGVELCYPY